MSKKLETNFSLFLDQECVRLQGLKAMYSEEMEKYINVKNLSTSRHITMTHIQENACLRLQYNPPVLQE
jgi:hypothetical protein